MGLYYFAVYFCEAGCITSGITVKSYELWVISDMLIVIIELITHNYQ